MTAATFIRFLRPATLAAPAAGIVGGAVAASGGWPESPGRAGLALLSALLLTGASNGINQIADVDTDRINRPDRPLPSGALGLRSAAALAALLTAAALFTAALVNKAFLICVALTIPLTAAYSLPPLRWKAVPVLANVAIATPRGLLLVIAGWAAGGGATRPEAWVLGSVAWLYVFGAATTKDFGDIEGDKATGCRTLPILLGPARAARIVAPFLVVPFLMYTPFAGAGLLPGGVAIWSVFGLLLAGLGLMAAQRLVRDPLPPLRRPHPAWGLMYLQLTLVHLGSAALFVLTAAG
ncbi:MAG: UbiA family prenyltransferase [Planctomycetota bacterium]|nr:UbiA family prenyltransferase [Planctomycetota bacterium]